MQARDIKVPLYFEDKVHLMQPTNPSVVRYSIDPNESTLTIVVYAGGVLSIMGHNPKIAARSFSGEVAFRPDDLAGSTLLFKVEATSLAVKDEMSTRDRKEIERRMQDEVLESQEFPEISYKCQEVSAGQTSANQYKVAMKGELTLHGVAKVQPISAWIVIAGETLRAVGDFTLKQSDYRITPVTGLAGGLKVKDEVKCKFEIVARKLGVGQVDQAS
ncbi:MAG TPA: YceI family protein [Candidatus Angelobacter sp.]|nr:YceI family protein [Candidatus Angelobacter sp.]